MKKIIAMFMVLMMAMAALTACGGKSGSEEEKSGVSVDSLETIGDVIDCEAEDKQSAVYDGKVVYAFKLGETYYRVIGTVTPEQEEEYMNVDILKEGYEDEQKAIVKDIKIDKVENLSDQMLSQEEMDSYVGKTGQEMQDAGWSYSGHDLENMEFWMEYGPFVYTVVFDGKVDEKDWDTFEDESGAKDMKVKSVDFNSIGDATNIE